jgi:hypothetical protein
MSTEHDIKQTFSDVDPDRIAARFARDMLAISDARRMTRGITSWIRLGWWDRIKVLFGANIVLSITREGAEAPRVAIGAVTFRRRSGP